MTATSPEWVDAPVVDARPPRDLSLLRCACTCQMVSRDVRDCPMHGHMFGSPEAAR